jgi:hypothetical protein
VDEVLRDIPELRRGKLALTGRVVEPVVGQTTLVDDRGAELVPFRLSDGTGRMLVWSDRSKLAAPLKEGDRVRVTGQSFLVPSQDGEHIRFIASAVGPE